MPYDSAHRGGGGGGGVVMSFDGVIDYFGQKQAFLWGMPYNPAHLWEGGASMNIIATG